jgi:hypothetical protein
LAHHARLTNSARLVSLTGRNCHLIIGSFLFSLINNPPIPPLFGGNLQMNNGVRFQDVVEPPGEKRVDEGDYRDDGYRVVKEISSRQLEK